MRAVILGLALFFTAVLGFLTVYVIVSSGRVNVLEILSLLVLGMVGFGVLGALTNPPDRRG